MYIKNKIKKNKGFSLLELVLAIAIFSMASISVGYLIVDSVTTTDVNSKKIVATLLAKEGLEAVRSIRDTNGFSSVTNGSSQGLSFDNVTNTWSLVPTPDVSEDIYTRTISISINPDYLHTKTIISTVTVVSGSRTISTSLTSYLTEWR